MRGKIFTRDEANRMLPLVRRIVRSARARQRLISRKRDEISEELATARADEPRVRALRASCARLHKEIEDCSGELEALGCFLREPESGVVECYADLNGRIVYLTWLPPAREFEWFHSLETSYLKRVPLPSTQAPRVSRATEA